METKVCIKMMRALSATMKNSKTFEMYKNFDFAKENKTEIEELQNVMLAEFGNINYELTRMIEAIETMEKYK